jgi:tetratricopeptide (TPR) repeat protein
MFFNGIKSKKENKKEHLLVFTYNQLSKLFLRIGKLRQSEEVLTTAISISERNNDTIHLIECLVSLGDCSIQQGRFEQAIPPYQKAEELLKTSKNSEKKCEIAINLGYCYQKLGNQKLFEKYRDIVFQANTEMKWGT